MSSPNPFPLFDRISPIVFLHSPTSSTSLTGNRQLIILATWMNAPIKLINLYATSYRTHFPDAQILLITCAMTHLFLTPESKYQALLEPALPILENARSAISAAVYSNGGAFGLSSLARLYAMRNGRPLPVRSILLDSCPGVGADLGSGQRAILASIPPTFRRPPFRYLIIPLLKCLLILSSIILQLLRRSDPITAIRRALLDDKILVQQGRRTYIYSKEDEMVGWRAVEQHADEAERRGSAVRREKSDGSGHVAHARKDGNRYWKIVVETLGVE